MKRLLLALLLFTTPALAQNPGVTTQGAVTANDCVKFVNRNLIASNGAACAGATSPGGSSGQLQYNNAGAFGGISGWTTDGTNNLTGGTAAVLNWNSDQFLTRGAAATLQFGAANVDTGPVAQTIRAQGVITGSGTSNVAGSSLTIASGQGKGNATGSSLNFQTPAVVASGTGAQTMTTVLTLQGTTGTFAGGVVASSAGYGVAGGSGAAGGMTSSGTTLRLNSLGTGTLVDLRDQAGLIASFTSATHSFISGNLILTGPSAATWQFGAANAASPVAQTLQAQGSRAGTDSDVGGAGLTVRAGAGTGIGALSTLTLQSPIAVASGSGAQTQTTGWRVNNGTGVSTGYTVATLPAAAIAGARAHVTDQLTTCAATGVALTGGGTLTCPAFYNGAVWVGG